MMFPCHGTFLRLHYFLLLHGNKMHARLVLVRLVCHNVILVFIGQVGLCPRSVFTDGSDVCSFAQHWRAKIKRKMPSPMGTVTTGCYGQADAGCLSMLPSLFLGVSARAVAFPQLRGIFQHVPHEQWASAKRVCFPESAFSDWKEEIPIASAHKWTDWESLGERLYPLHLIQCGSKK